MKDFKGEERSFRKVNMLLFGKEKRSYKSLQSKFYLLNNNGILN